MSLSLTSLPSLCHVIYRLILFTYVSVTVLMKFLVCLVSIFFFYLFFMRRHCLQQRCRALICVTRFIRIMINIKQTNKEKYNLPILLSLPLSLALPLALISSVWRKRESAYIPPLFLLNFYFVFLQFIYSYFDIYSKNSSFW